MDNTSRKHARVHSDGGLRADLSDITSIDPYLDSPGPDGRLRASVKKLINERPEIAELLKSKFGETYGEFMRDLERREADTPHALGCQCESCRDQRRSWTSRPKSPQAPSTPTAPRASRTPRFDAHYTSIPSDINEEEERGSGGDTGDDYHDESHPRRCKCDACLTAAYRPLTATPSRRTKPSNNQGARQSRDIEAGFTPHTPSSNGPSQLGGESTASNQRLLSAKNAIEAYHESARLTLEKSRVMRHRMMEAGRE